MQTNTLASIQFKLSYEGEHFYSIYFHLSSIKIVVGTWS